MPDSTIVGFSVPDVKRLHALRGPLVTAGVLVAIELLERASFDIASPSPIALLCVAYSAFAGGLRVGLISSVIALLYGLYFFSMPGRPFHYAADDLMRIAVLALTAPAMALLVGALKRRAERAAAETLRAQELQMSLLAERRYGAELQEVNRLKDESLAREQLAHAEAETARQRLTSIAEARDRALAEAELLNVIAIVASGEDDLLRILSATLDRLARLIRFSGGSIALVEGDELIIRAAVGPFTASALGQRMPRGVGRSWQVVESGEPYLCNDLVAAGVKPQSADAGSSMRSYLAVPLVWRGHTFGLLEVDSTEPDVFQTADLELMQAVAVALSGPIEMAQRYAQQVLERQRVEHLAAERAAILSQIVDGVIIADPAGRITFVNEAARRLHGAAELGVPIEAYAETYHLLTLDGQPYPPEELPLARAVLRSETVMDAEWRIRRPDGREIVVQGSATPVMGEDGARLGAVLVLRDVTAQRALERQKDDLLGARDRALAQAEAAQRRLAFLAEASTTLVASLDYEATLASVARLAVPRLADWCVVYIHAEDGSFRRLTAAHTDPQKQRLLEELGRRYPADPDAPHGYAKVMREGWPELITEVTDALLEEIARDQEHLGLLRELGLASQLCVPLLVSGQTFGAIALASGKPGHRYGPADLILGEELARRASLAIENARLYREAQEAIRARDHFLSIASHELKTPLTALLGHAQMIQRRNERAGTLSERDQRALRVIVGQIERLNKLVAAMLDFSRIQTGQLSIERHQVDLRVLIRRVVEEIQLASEQHTIAFGDHDEPLIVEGDELRLEQVVQNLIGNAIKYSPKGGLVDVRVEQHGALACVEVTDQGIGIPQEALPRLFQRFYRAHNVGVNGQRISGLGLGLYVIKEIVALHGGTVEVRSREGEGSTFTVCLPLAKDEE